MTTEPPLLGSRWLATGQVARMFGISTRTVVRWAEVEVLPCMRTSGGERRFNRLEMERLLEHGVPRKPRGRPRTQDLDQESA